MGLLAGHKRWMRILHQAKEKLDFTSAAFQACIIAILLHAKSAHYANDVTFDTLVQINVSGRLNLFK